MKGRGRRGEIADAAQLGMAVVPIVGPVVSQALALFESQRRNVEVDAFLAALAARLGSVEEGRFDQDFVNGADFQAATLRSLDAARFTIRDEKRQLIAAVLAGAATKDRPSGLDIEAIVDTLAGLTASDLALARLLWIEAGSGAPLAIVTSVIGPTDYPDLKFHLKRLEAYGLIADTAGQYFDYGGQYELTPTFHRLMALAEAGGLKLG